MVSPHEKKKQIKKEKEAVTVPVFLRYRDLKYNFFATTILKNLSLPEAPIYFQKFITTDEILVLYFV